MKRSAPIVREAALSDLETVGRIYNEGIADGGATLETSPKTANEMNAWWSEHAGRFALVVAEDAAGSVVGWASLNVYDKSCAYDGIADLSIYVARMRRGSGVGRVLIDAIEKRAKANAFHKIVLFALTSNANGRRLYAACGFREIGVFAEHGRVDGRFIDVVAMEKILKPSVLFVCRHNTGRSQMAEAFLRHLTGDRVDIASAGTVAADVPDPGAVAVMAEIGIDLSSARPKLLDTAMLARADRIVTMGCDVEGVPRIDADWGLPDPKGQSAERVREIRDLVRTRCENLARELLSVS